MQNSALPPDYPEIFRTQDSVGSDSSLFVRVMRQLAHEGKPMGDVFLFNAVIGGDRIRAPLGMLTFTKNNRIVFWPVLPHSTLLTATRSKVNTPDHITLELPSERSHITAYTVTGKASHASNGWKCVTFPAPPLRLWFILLVQMRVLTEQDLLVQRNYFTPSSDKDRRMKEMEKFIQNLVTLDVRLPSLPSVEDYLCFGFYLTPEYIPQDRMPASLFSNQAMTTMVDNWPTQSEFPALISQYRLGEQHFLVTSACPPGKLTDPLCVGFPTGIETDNPKT